MLKRTWIILALMVGTGVLVLSACGSGDLAPDLTPIPTLPAGQEPDLKEAVSVAAVEDEGTPDETQLLALGQELFTTTCTGCHGATNGAGPALTGMGERAAERVEGLSAAEYLHQSIVEPGAFVVENFNNIMPATYGDQFSEDELDALVAYILAEGGAAGDASSTGDEAEPGDAANGETLFTQACAGCHGEKDGAGPGRPGMGERAAERVENLSAVEYLHQSIVEPGAFVVEGFSDIMPPTFGDQFSEDEINDLVAYMLTQ